MCHILFLLKYRRYDSIFLCIKKVELIVVYKIRNVELIVVYKIRNVSLTREEKHNLKNFLT